MRTEGRSDPDPLKNKKNTPKTPQKGICFRQLAMPVLLASSVNALSIFCNLLKFKTLQNSFPTDWERFPYRLGTCFSGFNLQLGNFNLLTFVFCRIPISLKFDFGCKDKKNIWKANKYYEKHPLLGAADRATLYAFVARKQPHE